MAVESDKNRRLTDDLNQLQQKVDSLESELLGLKQVGDGRVDFQNLQREMDKLIRENEDHKHRWGQLLLYKLFFIFPYFSQYVLGQPES